MKKLLIQVIEFVGLSGIGWILDFSVFTALGFISENVSLNNFISSWVGVTFVFLTATRKIFQNRSRLSLKWKYLIYLAYQLVLIILISQLLGKINSFIVRYVNMAVLHGLSKIISKILVTPITMVLNFIVMKNVIEKI